MKLSVQLASSSLQPSRDMVLSTARMADNFGLHSMYVSDHIALPFSASSNFEWSEGPEIPIDPDAHFWEPLTLLSYLACYTSRIRLGTSVLVGPYRHAVVAAKQIACLDALSGGRLTLGIGSGWYEEEFRTLGVSFPDRGAITEETIAILRSVCSEHPVSFDGSYYRVHRSGILPKPIQEGGIPVFIGGNSRVAIDRAVRLGQGWQPALLPEEELLKGLETMAAICRQRGRPVEELGVALRVVVRVTTSKSVIRPDESGWRGSVIGTVNEVEDSLSRYADAGVTEVIADLRTCRDEEAQETLGTLSDLPVFDVAVPS